MRVLANEAVAPAEEVTFRTTKAPQNNLQNADRHARTAQTAAMC